MSGIPVYTQSPTSPSTASGVVPPQTTAPATAHRGSHPAPQVATTRTSTASSSTSYPPAQPAAAAIPAPTAAAQRYTPLQQPTPTTKEWYQDGVPPAPQPGAVPHPATTRNIPPPPKAGEYQPPQGIAVPTYPPPMAIPLPSTERQPPTQYNARPSLEHPPGYSQNVYASELTSEQRRAQDTQNASFMGDSNKDDRMDSEGVLNTVKKWAASAGAKISEAESEVIGKVTGAPRVFADRNWSRTGGCDAPLLGGPNERGESEFQEIGLAFEIPPAPVASNDHSPFSAHPRIVKLSRPALALALTLTLTLALTLTLTLTLTPHTCTQPTFQLPWTS
ncbi:hypothetical protein B7494_g3908 [Chlorociboria aeruginascens]|nr:hypothetical protein B7494_g3908 [Chlorociboria aeruginascens]